jgi:hypothetical protein
MYLLWWPRKGVSSYVWLQTALSVLSCASGASLASQAMIDDRFGDRPALSAAFYARTSAANAVTGLISPMLGAMLYQRNRHWGLRASLVCVGLCLPVVQAMSESLPLSDRRGDKGERESQSSGSRPQAAAAVLSSARRWVPIGNIAVLFSHSRRLARLAAADVLYLVANGNNININTLALDPALLAWRPAHLSYLSSFVAGCTALSHGWLLPLLVRTSGVAGAFRLSSCGSIASFVMMSQCWRPAATLRRAVGFVAAEGLRTGVGMASPVCLRSLLVSAAVADGIGTGELNAALHGSQSIVNTLSPLAWATAYSACGRWGQRGRWYYMPGATWVASALMRLLVLQMVANVPPAPPPPPQARDQ